MAPFTGDTPPEFQGMAPNTIRAAIDCSLSRLGVDHVDLYYAHFDDPKTPLEESVEAMSSLVDAGKVRALGLSNYSTARIREWFRICDEGNFHRPVALQPEYSLMERGIETELLPTAEAESVKVVPYYALDRGFLTGKYNECSLVNSPRASIASAYLHQRGHRVLQFMADIATVNNTQIASAAIAWLIAQPGVAAPITSARNRQQFVPLLAGASLPN